MMKRRWLLMGVLLGLIGCGENTAPQTTVSSANQPAVATEQVVQTSPSPVVVAIKSFDFNALLEDDDLPAGFTFDTTPKTTVSVQFKNVPQADQTLYRAALTKKNVNGGVSIFAYENPSKAATAYKAILETFESDPATARAEVKRKKVDVGEKAETMTAEFKSINQTVIQGVILRCNVAAHVVLGTDDTEAITDYMKTLDTKLTTALCP